MEYWAILSASFPPCALSVAAALSQPPHAVVYIPASFSPIKQAIKNKYNCFGVPEARNKNKLAFINSLFAMVKQKTALIISNLLPLISAARLTGACIWILPSSEWGTSTGRDLLGNQTAAEGPSFQGTDHPLLRDVATLTPSPDSPCSNSSV